MVKVSVIVPVYNGEKYLRECLDSLVHQTLDSMEIIIIDDASIDHSMDIIRDYEFCYHNIKVICNDKNLGPGACRNLGINLSSGEYIGFVDSDDFVEYCMFDSMYRGALDNKRPDIVSCGIRFSLNDIHINSNYQPRWKGSLFELNNNSSQFYWESPSCCNKLFKKELIDGYRFLENCMWEDVAFTYSMLIKANHILSFPDNFYIYRKNIETGISSRGYHVNAPLLDIFRVSDEIERVAVSCNKFDEYREIVRFLQVSSCLQRLSEINCWNVPLNEKNKVMLMMYHAIVGQYGSEEVFDRGILSSKIDLPLVNNIKKLQDNFKSHRSFK